jgi:hypothetical protein
MKRKKIMSKKYISVILLLVLFTVGAFYYKWSTDNKSKDCAWLNSSQEDGVLDAIWTAENDLVFSFANKIFKVDPLLSDSVTEVIEVDYAVDELLLSSDSDNVRYSVESFCHDAVGLVEGESESTVIRGNGSIYGSFIYSTKTTSEGDLISIDTLDNKMAVFDVSKNALIGEIKGRYDDILDPIFDPYNFSPDGSKIVIAFGGYFPEIYDLKNLELTETGSIEEEQIRLNYIEETKQTTSNSIENIAIDNNSELLAISVSNPFTHQKDLQGVRVFDITEENGKMVYEKTGEVYGSESLVFSPDSKYLVISEDENVVLNLETLEKEILFDAEQYLFSGDSKYIALINTDEILVYDIDDNKYVYKLMTSEL